MKLLDTIAAISTPYGKGGVALIRISGEDACRVGEAIFAPASGKRLGELAHGQMVYGEIRSPDGVILDDGMAVCFHAPHSFTGEDTVELTCHGGVRITAKVLQAALCAGARAAEAGEFTRRAYIGGKMRLSEAEALGLLLDAKSDSQLLLARNGMKGGLADRTEELYTSLRTVLSSVWAAIDFPEEDLAELSRVQMREQVATALSGIRELAATYGTGRAITEGVATVICGRTNAGKSSVYNRIVGYNAAIVTEVEGTTRDVLRETATLGKTLLRLCDTAGLRQTEDRVERIGIERTREEMKQAGLILAVFDASCPLTEEDLALTEEIGQMGVPAIALLNKSDRQESADMTAVRERFPHTVAVSAADGQGFDRLSVEIDRLFIDGSLNVQTDAVVTGARQYAALMLAAEALEATLTDLDAELPLDLCCVGLETALTSLGQVDGRELGEEIVSEIFSRFCVGK
ncbi:MAG: tRNA uridine-5-carboxymethylaminomethyl(34) synthesis GTPase MnmE [Ruminococcaceae bacterium]|nr:tRNA uridine-5-carboxymethylaminomethyl(34) synthesis GTPase MnmE [Oscillospiraceae bacterium]